MLSYLYKHAKISQARPEGCARARGAVRQRPDGALHITMQ